MNYKENYSLILKEIESVCSRISADDAEKLVHSIMSSNNVFLVGVGRVLLSLKAFSKRLNHLGIKSYIVGDINEPAITEHDLLIVGSGSGETVFPLNIARIAKNYRAKVIHIGSNPNSSLKKYTDLFVRIPIKTKANLPDEIQSRQIMSSLFEQTLYIFCDTVCMMILEKKNIDIDSLWQLHANLE